MKRFILVAAVLMSFAAPARAQSVAPSPTPSADPNDRMAQAHARIEAMQEHVTKLELSMDQARADKDIVKLNYLSDKIKALKGLLKVSMQSVKNLAEALAKHDVSAANHEEEKMVIAESKSDTLFDQSQSAVGQSTVYSGKTQVEMTINEKVAGSTGANPVQVLLTPPPAAVMVNLRPPAASPFQ